MVKIEKKWEEKFDYTTLNDRDKKIVKEVISFLKEEDLSKEKEDSILQKFQVKEIPTYDLENSIFLKHVKKCKLFYNDQGYIREGKYPNVVQFPIVSIQSDIRNFEKLYLSIYEEALTLNKK